jgi:glutaryl-CoA dehydrogenase
MATAAAARKPEYSPPPINGDYHSILDCLDEKECAVARRVRDFAEKKVAPIIADFRAGDEFPHEIVAKLPALHFAGGGFKGCGLAGGSRLLNGMIRMELAHADSSIVDFYGSTPGSWRGGSDLLL